MVLHLTQSREDTHTAESDRYTAGDPYNHSLSRWLRNQAQTDVRIHPNFDPHLPCAYATAPAFASYNSGTSLIRTPMG